MGHPVNAQYRNNVERSINVVKRWVREIGGITNRQPFPVLGFTEWEFIFQKVSHDLNIIPIAKGQEYSQFDLPTEYRIISDSGCKEQDGENNCMIKRMRA